MRTRFAPSPTGLFHLGSARTAYINYLAAKSSGGEFILRIDDTDVERNRKEYTDIIFKSLDWLGLEPDNVYYQSERTNLYVGEAKALLNKNKAKVLDNGAITIMLPNNLPKIFKDTISGDIPITETNHAQIHEKVILLRGESYDKETGKTDRSKLGFPTYQFSSVVDDYFMHIDWIIRGVDHITNTPKQIAIWCALNEIYGFINCPKPLPLFTHLGLIFKDKKKLSKRDGAASLLWYQEQGYTPEAMLNWMLRLGWSPKGDDGKETKYISKKEAIDLFSKGNLKNSPCNYDLAKLDFFNKFYRS